MKLPSSDLKEFIQQNDRFIVAGHRDPDGDCLCSSMALKTILQRYGKEAIAYNEGPFERTEIDEWSNSITSNIPEEWITDNKTAVIIVDCSTPERIGSISTRIAHLPTAVIDHHASGIEFGNVRYIDIESPSTTLLIKRTAQLLDIEINENEAQMLFFGFCTDTGYFRHLSNKRSLELKEAADLMASGADPKKCYQQMTGGKSISSRILLGKILSRVEMHFDNKILFVYDTKEDIEEFGSDARDADALYSQLFTVEDCEAVIYIKYKDDETFIAGLRAMKSINVGEIAAQLGGGGHKLASGLKFKGSFDSLKKELLNRVNQKEFRI